MSDSFLKLDQFREFFFMQRVGFHESYFVPVYCNRLHFESMSYWNEMHWNMLYWIDEWHEMHWNRLHWIGGWTWDAWNWLHWIGEWTWDALKPVAWIGEWTWDALKPVAWIGGWAWDAWNRLHWIGVWSWDALKPVAMNRVGGHELHWNRLHSSRGLKAPRRTSSPSYSSFLKSFLKSIALHFSVAPVSCSFLVFFFPNVVCPLIWIGWTFSEDFENVILQRSMFLVPAWPYFNSCSFLCFCSTDPSLSLQSRVSLLL